MPRQPLSVAPTPPADHDPRACDRALSRAFAFLGKRWNGVILATLLAGPSGFADLSRAVSGISDSVLAERLAELARAGLVGRVVRDGPPISVRYELTESGQALAPTLSELTRWAAEYLPASDCPSVSAADPCVSTADPCVPTADPCLEP